jgi:hypothetical protein
MFVVESAPGVFSNNDGYVSPAPRKLFLFSSPEAAVGDTLPVPPSLTDEGYGSDESMIDDYMADECHVYEYCLPDEYTIAQDKAEDRTFATDARLPVAIRQPGHDAFLLPLDSVDKLSTRNRPSAVVNAVFTTYELLEQILKDMSMVELLRYQRVSKNWRSVIQSSLTIQQKLFMAPAARPTDEDIQSQNYNPLLLSRCLISRPDKRLDVRLSRSTLTPPPLQQLIFRIPSDSEPQASWRRMFISQPPLAAVRLEVSVYGEVLRAGELDSTSTFRMGDIVENPGYEMCGHGTGNGQECRLGMLRVIDLPLALEI